MVVVIIIQSRVRTGGFAWATPVNWRLNIGGPSSTHASTIQLSKDLQTSRLLILPKLVQILVIESCMQDEEMSELYNIKNG